MQKAKQAATNFLSKNGKHDTIVDQDIRGPVTEEHIRPHEHEIVTTAVDTEIHQDHHQTRIQPINVQETLPEKSSHVLSPIQHTEYEHGNQADLRAKLEQDAALYKNSSETHETTHSVETAPVISGEHIHHHVHEHIQPIIHKETISPHVIHKTVPIHETHHAMPIHHEVTSLPAQTLEEFTAASGGELQPKTTTTLREFEGCPGPYNRDRQLPSTALHPDSSSYKTNGQGVAGGMSKTSTISQPHGMSKTDSMNMADSTSKADGMSKTDSLGKSGNLNTSDSMNNTDSYGDTQAQEGNYTYGDKLGKMAGVAVGASGAGAAAATAAGSSVGGKTGSGLQQAGKTVEAAKPRSGGSLSSSSSGSQSRRRSIMDKLNPLKDSSEKKGVTR